jgi:hypothetical protein
MLSVQVVWEWQPRTLSLIARSCASAQQQHCHSPRPHTDIPTSAQPNAAWPLHSALQNKAPQRRRGSISNSDATDATGRSTVHENPVFGNSVDGALGARISAHHGTMFPSAAHGLPRPST